MNIPRITFKDLLPFSEIINSFITDKNNYNQYLKLKKLHTDYFNKYSKNNKIEVSNKEFYIMLGFKENELIISKYNFNPHNDLANFRRIYEVYNILHFLHFDKELGIFVNEVWDIGAGPRLIRSAICRVAILPILDELDIFRNSRIQNYNEFTIIINDKLENVLKKYSNYIKKNKPLLNFTDSLYYLQNLKLDHFVDYPKDSIIGFGTAHVLVADGPLVIGSSEFGHVKSIEFNNTIYMIMEVFGNNKPYVHPVFFKDLLYNNQHIIDYNNEFMLQISKQNSVNLGATLYISFVIYKLEKKDINLQIVPTFTSNMNVISKIIGEPQYEEVSFSDSSKLYNIKINKLTLGKVRSIYYSYKQLNEGKEIDTLSLANQILIKYIDIPIQDLPLIIKILQIQDKNLVEQLNSL
jgi:hypothetical protein